MPLFARISAGPTVEALAAPTTGSVSAAADGKHPGLPIVILGGDHGDVPLDVAAGQLIAD